MQAFDEGDRPPMRCTIAASLRIEGASLVTIALDDIKTLAPNTPQEITVPVTIRFTESLAAANALRQGKANFELAGSIGSGSATVPFRVQDLLNLAR